MAEQDEAIRCPEMGLGCDRCVTLWCTVPDRRRDEGSISGHAPSMERFLLRIGFLLFLQTSGRQPQHCRGSGSCRINTSSQINDPRTFCQNQPPEQSAYL